MLTEIDYHKIARVGSLTRDSGLRASVEHALATQLQSVRHPSLCADRLQRYVENSRIPTALLSQWDRDKDLLGTLVQTLDCLSPMVEWLIDDPDGFDPLRFASDHAVDAHALKDRLLTELRCLEDDRQFLAALRRFRRREWLRVLFGVELHGLSDAIAEEQLSAIVEAVVMSVFDIVFQERSSSTMLPSDGWVEEREPTAVTLLAIGTLGGQAMDFNSPCELMAIYTRKDLDASGRETTMQQVEVLQKRMQRLRELLESFDPEHFRVLFPMATHAPDRELSLMQPAWRWLENAAANGDASHRLHLIKARPLAGSRILADAFLVRAEPFVYPRYVTRSEIASLSAYLRKLDRTTRAPHTAASPEEMSLQVVERLQREIESLVIFLQLIHGWELPELRVTKTSTAVDALAKFGVFHGVEYAQVTQAHALANRCKFAIQTEAMSDSERKSLASQLRDATIKIQQLGDRLRGEVLVDQEPGGDQVDLILDPQPDPDWARCVVEPFHFQKPDLAVKNLQELATEDSQVLSSRRCRYFLSTIAPKLLERIGQTPLPDRTLDNLVETCRSIGAKGVLWELFSLHQPSMDLYVRLCGASPYLVGILTSNPGMVDELLDSLMLGRLPSEEQLSVLLDELCRGAEDIEAIVQSFKNTMHLTIGVRDILGKESISETHLTLANVADVCLQQTIQSHYNALVKRYGVPSLEGGHRCQFAVLALGKLGSREPNYHSDVTILFLHEGAGNTRPSGPMRHHQPISNDFFFHQLAQRVAQGVNRLTRFGRLFELQNWRFTSATQTNLAWSLQAFEELMLFASNDESSRLMLATARAMAGDQAFQTAAYECVRRVLHARRWTDSDTAHVLANRFASETTASPRNLKRGVGGTLDIELLTQILSLKQFNTDPNFVVSGTIDALEQLRRAGHIEAHDSLRLKDAYNFLRGVESGLRLMHTKARHDLPSDPMELARLAYGLHIPDPNQLEKSCDEYRAEVRSIFRKVLRIP